MKRTWVNMPACSIWLLCHVALSQVGADDLAQKRKELAAASNQITAKCAGRTEASGRPDVNCNEVGNLARKLIIYNHMNEQGKQLAAVANEMIAKCAGRTDADCNNARATAEQTLKEIGVASAVENEWFRAMGFPSEVRSWDTFKVWFAKGLSSDSDSTLDRGRYAIEFAKREITTYCNTIYGSMYGTNNQGDYKQCVQDYNPEMVSSMHEFSWAFCFAKYDWTGYKPKGTQQEYADCMTKNDIYSAFCDQSALAVYDKFQQSSPNSKRVPPRPCGGPLPTGREFQVLRMRANQLGITAPTTMTPIGNTSTTPSSADSTRVVVPVGSMLIVKTIDQIDVNAVKSGKTFRAQLTDPLHFEGKEIIPKGADIFLKAHVKDGGGWVLVSLDYAVVNGMKLPLETNDIMLVAPSMRGNTQSPSPGRIQLPQLSRGGRIQMPLPRPSPGPSVETPASNAVIQKVDSILVFRITGSR